MYTILTISVSFLNAGGHKCMNQDQVSIKRDQLGINLQFVPSVSITQPGLGWAVEIQTKALRRFIITEKAPTRAFSWLKSATTAFTFKTLLRHYAKRALTPRSLNVKLGPRRKGHKGRVVWLA